MEGSEKHKKTNNQQEETLLRGNNQELLFEPPKLPDRRKYIPFLPKIYWFFYRKPVYFLAFIPSFLGGLIQIGNTISIAQVIDSITKTNGLYLIKKYALLQFILSILRGILSFLSSFCWKQIRDSISIKIRRVLFKSILMKDVEFFDKRTFGELHSTLDQEVSRATSLFSFSKAEQITLLGYIISGVTFCFSINWRLTIFAIIASIFSSQMTKVWAEVGVKDIKRFIDSNANCTSIVEEAISNIRTIFSFNSQRREYEKYKDECDAYCDYYTNSEIYLKASNNLTSLLSQGSLCAFLNIGCFFILKGQLTPGFLFTLSTEAFGLANKIVGLYYFIVSEKRYLRSADKIFDIIDSAPSVPFTNEGHELESFTGRIEFRDVWFKYPTRNAWVLKNVSFEVNPSEITAFVGHSGSGKSTILQLIMRFYDVSAGQILFDGVNIKEIDPRWIHRVISVVQQDPCLFSVSIRQNILYGLDKKFYKKKFGLYENLSLDEIQMNSNVDHEVDRCIEIAQAKSFVDQLPLKKDTLIGEKGAKLSGGQKQRIAIARAVIRDPIVMITDEATSALDAENENKVQNALESVMVNRTSIIIAHRLGTIKEAKTIYVFDSGEMIESGSKNELIEKRGAFYNLVERQLNF